MSTVFLPLERTAADYEVWGRNMLNIVRERRACVEAIPRQANQFSYEEGQILSLLWMEAYLVGLLEGTASA